MSSERLNQANGRLKAANVGVTIEQIGRRLYLQATLPPKPNSDKEAPYQQRIALGIHANPTGISLAEKEARKVGALLDCKEFSWEPYLKEVSNPLTVGEWIKQFEVDYFQRRPRTPETATTWKTEYQRVFSTLVLDKPLSVELLRTAIVATVPDSRTRKRFCDVLGRLAKFANLEADFKPLVGSYSPQQVAPRSLPDDKLIAQVFNSLAPGPWRWAYGMMATYGLRNHEIFYCDLSRFPVLLVLGGKTGSRRVWPIFPEWATAWELQAIAVPNCTAKSNTDFGQRVTRAFKRLGVPFAPYNLRHAWAVRSMEFGLPDSLAAAQMGHSVDVHTKIYHHWISEDVHQRAYDLLMSRSDRPRAPLA